MAQQISRTYPASAQTAHDCRCFGRARDLQRNAYRDRSARRQYRPRRRADTVSRRNSSEPFVSRQDTPCRPRRHEPDRRSRRHSCEGARGSSGSGLLLSVKSGRGRLMHDRRQHFHQCRRRECVALRHGAPARARHRSRAGRRTRARPPTYPAQGQYGLRSEATVHRRRRYAWRHHGCGIAPVPEADNARNRVSRGS